MAKLVDNVTFRRCVATLRAECPIECESLVVKRKSNPHIGHNPFDGYMWHEEVFGRRFVTIIIDLDLTYIETIDTLIHEWAHALSGELTHGPKWGAAYAKCYRAFHDCA